jgi:hypothetical protein
MGNPQGMRSERSSWNTRRILHGSERNIKGKCAEKRKEKRSGEEDLSIWRMYASETLGPKAKAGGDGVSNNPGSARRGRSRTVSACMAPDRETAKHDGKRSLTVGACGGPRSRDRGRRSSRRRRPAGNSHSGGALATPAGSESDTSGRGTSWRKYK